MFVFINTNIKRTTPFVSLHTTPLVAAVVMLSIILFVSSPSIITATDAIHSFDNGHGQDNGQDNGQDKDHTSTDERPRGLELLLGKERSEYFLENIWGKEWHHFPASTSSSSFSSSSSSLYKDLWSLALIEYHIKNSNYRHWIYEQDIKLVKNGETYYKSPEPAKWSEVMHHGVVNGGASMVLSNIHNRHAPVQDLCRALEGQLYSFVSANSYLSPSGSRGFSPHYDGHDIFVLHLEGEKTWTVCDDVRPVDLYQRKYKNQHGIFQMGDDFGICHEVILKPGDVLYAPMGTIHYAEVINSQGRNYPQEYSLHLTVSLDRQAFTWGRFIEDLLADSRSTAYEEEMSKTTASSLQLQQQMPMKYLQTIGQSLDNQDIPSEIFVQMYSDLNDMIQNEIPLPPGGTGTGMQSTLYSLIQQESPYKNRPFDQTVELFRQKLVMGTLSSIQSCPGAIGLQKRSDFNSSHVMFRRLLTQRVILVDFGAGNLILATGSHGNDGATESKLPSHWKGGVRYALGAYTGAAGQFFTIKDLQQQSNLDYKTCMALIQKLLNACVLEARLIEIDTESLESVEEENSDSRTVNSEL